MVGAWSRTARFTSALRPATSPRVGPGAYFPCEAPCLRCESPDAAFLARAEARPPLVPKEKLLVPPPNYYYPHRPRRIKGGESPSYTSQRLRSEPQLTADADPGPGPGTYSPRSPTCSPRSAPCGRRTCRAKGAECSCVCWQGKLVRGHLAGHGCAAPSVPPKGACGYRPARGFCRAAGTTWEPVEQSPPAPPPGPLTYDIGDPERCQATLKYKGNFWSLMRTGARGHGRCPCRGKAGALVMGPGPADYDPYGSGCGALAALQAEWAELRAKKWAEAPLLRSADIAERNTRRENLPSAATYDLSELPKHCSRCVCHPPPFLSGARRFRRVKRGGPGPADTRDPRSALEVLDRLHSRVHPPFSSTAARTCEMGLGGTPCSPGPAAYDTERGVRCVTARNTGPCSIQALLAPFGSRSSRLVPHHLEDPCHPGPALYQRLPRSRRARAASACFRSKTERMCDRPRKWLADLGTYNWAEQADALATRTSHLCRRAKLRCPFLHGGSRFNYAKRPDYPGPTEYETRLNSVADAPLGFMDRSPVHKPPPDTPGPAHYHIHRMYTDTVVWPTFNRTLPNPVERSRPTPPCLPLAQLVALRKRLRCFLKVEDNPFHCI